MQYDPQINAEELRPHYSKTLSDERFLLTAHSHRAWLDVIASGQMKPVELAFEHVDQKWGEIFGEVIPEFQRGVAARIGTDKPDHIAIGENTHELVTRVLSCFPWDSSARFVTTDSEFHSLRRQLARLEEDRVNVEYVSTNDRGSLTDRIVNAITPGTNAVLVSTVYFNEGYVLQNVGKIVSKAREVGATIVLDAYHHYNVRQLKADEIGRDIFITGGGYKYAGAGEGAAWLKVPEGCEMRPRITGWFADFGALEAETYPNPVEYGSGAQRFLGATRDISGICRQIEVFKFMDEHGMSVEVLERNNLHQTGYMIYLFDKLGLNEGGATLLSSRNDAERGPFLAIDLGTAQRAHQTYETLRDKHNVLTDTRGSVIRLGPAPYITKHELEYGMEKLKEVLTN